MAKMKKVSESLTNAENSVINETLTSKIENMEQNENVSEVLNETQENTNDEIVSETLTVETLTTQIKSAKKELSSLNDKYDFDETNPEIIAKENEISKLVAERKKLELANEKQRLEKLVSETLANAKNDLIAKLGITNEKLEELIATAKNPEAKDTLVNSFNTVFGKKPIVALDGETGKSLTKRVAKEINGWNVTKNVKEMLSAGNDNETIVNSILANTDLDETKAKKRLNDIRWGWEIENGLREKPNK